MGNLQGSTVILKLSTSTMVQRTISLLVFCYVVQMSSCQEAEETDTGNFLKKAGKFFNDNKAQVFSLIGLEEGKEDQFLTDLLGKMNIDSETITKVTSSFTDQEGVKQLIQTFSNPEKLPELLHQQTNLDQSSIDGFVQKVKDYIPSSGSHKMLLSFFWMTIFLIFAAKL